MRIAEIRKEVEDLAPNILKRLGFDKVGSLGEFIKTQASGDKHAVLIDVVKDSSSFSISVRVFAFYKLIEDLFKNVSSHNKYTINIYLAAKSIRFDDFSRNNVEEILNHLITTEALPFLEQYSTAESVFKNLNSSNYQEWITSDKVSQFKIKMASAVSSKNAEELENIKTKALDYCAKPWSGSNREIIKELCKSI
ncbi:MAG: hypothetical protein OEY36_07665 [Gammaproteobacteria bacterium]|nr:hypothetical protein [Gammaproteobacteria bacterium]